MTDLTTIYEDYLHTALEAQRIVADTAPFAPDRAPPMLACKSIAQGTKAHHVMRHAPQELRGIGYKRALSAHERLAREKAKADWTAQKNRILPLLADKAAVLLACIVAGPRFTGQEGVATLHTVVAPDGVWARLALRDRTAFLIDHAVPLDGHAHVLARLWYHALSTSPGPHDTTWRLHATLHQALPRPPMPHMPYDPDEAGWTITEDAHAPTLEGALLETALKGANSLLLPGRVESIHVLKELDGTERAWLDTWRERPIS